MSTNLDAIIASPEPLTNLFLARAAAKGEEVAGFAKLDGRWVPMSWNEVRTAVEELAAGLLELEVPRAEAVGIISNTRREWAQADMATLMVGGVVVGIYPTLTAPQVRYLVEHSGLRVCFVEDRAQRVKLLEATAGLGRALVVVTMEEKAEGEGVVTWSELRRRGAKRRRERPDELAKRNAENKSSDVVTYVYTSGTTGEPKGAMLTHANFHYVIHATISMMSYDHESSIGFLPLAHSLQRYASYLGLVVDVEGYYAESLDKLRENILEVRPTCFATVPRVLEKIHAAVHAKVEEGPPIRKRIFERAMAALHAEGQARRAGEEPGFRVRAAARIADRLVAEKIRGRLGGRVKWLGCGGAPLSREVHEFFEDVGIPILIGYGLTETSAPVTVSTLANRRIGTVGRPLPGTQVRIAEDGEILVKGPGVFVGYYKDEVATKAAFTEDGWFKTGDVGQMSRDGFLEITDRKKELIITAGGKNIAPQPLEERLKAHALVGQAVVIGDAKPYLTALLGVDPEAREQIAASFGIPKDAGAEVLEAHAGLRGALEAHVAAVNSGLPRFEQIKRWALLPGEMSIESGELTPTLKVKRRVVHERHAARIAALYAGAE